MPSEPALLLTCEHASNAVPDEFAALFDRDPTVLNTHRGWDPGALGIARAMREALGAPLLETGVSRLLVEPNRSLGHASLFSEFTRDLSEDAQRALIERYYTPHVEGVAAAVRTGIEVRGAVLHVGVHTCVDDLDGTVRDLDIALLFDPARAWEARLCAGWRGALERALPRRRIRFNEPYLGTDDGLTTSLRALFPDPRYAGVEIEVRQGLVADARTQRAVGGLLARTLQHALDTTDDA